MVGRVIAAHDPRSTVVHVHGWAKSLSPSIGPVVTKSQAAHVYTLHEYFLACPNGGFFDYRSGSICKRAPLGGGCLMTRCDPRSDLHKAWRVGRQIVLNSISRMPAELREIIYLAPEQRSIMEPHLSSQARWHYLPNAVAAKPEQRVRAEDNELFLFIGRLSPEKGAEVVAEAAALAGVPIAICGDGDRRGAVAAANGDAIMPGWVAEDEIEQWMRRARCILFPSLWYECNPLVVADALRLGLPLLVADSSVAKSSVEHGVHGLHVEAGNPQAWAKAMASLRSDDVVRRYSRNAFAAGQRLPEYPDYTDQLIDIYRMAIARRNGELAPSAAASA
jgi:glycosyltransferase involved in cell wall biosynthesis